MCAIVMLIRNNNDNIVISHEHKQMKWVRENELDKFNYFWPHLKRMIEKGFEHNRFLNKNSNE